MEDTFRALLGNPPEGDGPGQPRFFWALNLWIQETIGPEAEML